MRSTQIVTIGALISALGAATTALAAPPAPYINSPLDKKSQVSRAGQLDRSEQIDALRRKDQQIQQLIDDLKAGRHVDPSAIDRALK